MTADERDTRLGPSGIVADVLRALCLASAIVAWIALGAGEALLFAIVFVCSLVPRIARVPRPFDAAFAATLLAATWSSALGWYGMLWWLDLLIHLVTNGAVAAMAYLVLASVGVIPGLHDPSAARPRTRIVVLTTAFGLALGAVWEFLEWLAENMTGIGVHVGYDDSIGDMAFGAVGSLLAGFALVLWWQSGRTVQRGARAW